MPVLRTNSVVSTGRAEGPYNPLKSARLAETGGLDTLGNNQ